MEYRPSDSLKAAAAHLAELIMSKDPDLTRQAALFEQLRLPAGDPVHPPAQTKSNGKARQFPDGEVGIWKLSAQNGRSSFIRDMARRSEWPLWAGVHEIRPKGAKKRILLLGESVARGYFYDPYYTVAQELEALLNNPAVLGNTEVIDLARTSMELSGLTQITQSCMQLEPDAIVIFAGNNWRTDSQLTGDELLGKVWEKYRTEGFASVQQLIEEGLKKRATKYLQEVERIFIQKNIPVLFIIPEFNLRDWHSNTAEQILPWLPGDRLPQWISARERAAQALQLKDNETFGREAQEMVLLDPSNPLGHEWLGQYYLSRGQLQQARTCLEKARDTSLFNRQDSKPRCYSIIQQTIAEEAGALGIQVLHLPEVFSQVYQQLPGRELFLDYCHLTVDGIKTAMRFAAAAITGMLTQKELSPDNIKPSVLEPGDEAKAVAHFCAAIHNAHGGQREEILRYHCQRACMFYPGIETLVKGFADFSTRTTTTVLCKTFESMIVDGEMRQYEGGLGLASPRSRKLMDLHLIDQFAAILPSSFQKEVEELREQEHSIGRRKIDLLQSYYSCTFYSDTMAKPQPVFLQARALETAFYFIAPGGCAAFEIVYRTPKGADAGRTVKIFINDQEEAVTTLPMSSQWGKQLFSISGAALKKGVNKLVIHWPHTDELPGKEGKPVSSHALFNALFPPLGEVAAFSAVTCNIPVPTPVVESSGGYLLHH